jgi:hypothetical protein
MLKGRGAKYSAMPLAVFSVYRAASAKMGSMLSGSSKSSSSSKSSRASPGVSLPLRSLRNAEMALMMGSK